jgi:hypothetical protein
MKRMPTGWFRFEKGGMLVEQMFRVLDHPASAKTLFFSVNDLGDYHYAECTHLAEEKNIPVEGCLASTDGLYRSPGFKTDFHEHLEGTKPVSFKDFLFSLDSYRLRRSNPKDLSPSELLELTAPEFDTIPIVDETLCALSAAFAKSLKEDCSILISFNKDFTGSEIQEGGKMTYIISCGEAASPL